MIPVSSINLTTALLKREGLPCRWFFDPGSSRTNIASKHRWAGMPPVVDSAHACQVSTHACQLRPVGYRMPSTRNESVNTDLVFKIFALARTCHCHRELSSKIEYKMSCATQRVGFASLHQIARCSRGHISLQLSILKPLTVCDDSDEFGTPIQSEKLSICF